jgi:plastocyanin
MSVFRRLTIATLGAAVAVTCVEAAAHSVSQKGKSFAPGTVTVKVGEALNFQNDDDVTHNAFSTSKGNEFNSKVQPPGAVSSITFKQPGTVDVRCAFHPKMKLVVVVQQ